MSFEEEDNQDVLASGAYCEVNSLAHDAPHGCTIGRVTPHLLELGPIPWGEEGMTLFVRLPGMDALYSFQTRLLAASEEWGRGYWFAERPPSVQRMQRRRHLRAKVDLDAVLADLSKHPPVEHAAKVLDLSGGGLKLRLPAGFPARERQSVQVGFNLEARAVSAQAEVVRHYADALHTYLGVQFTGIDANLEEALVQTAFRAHWDNWSRLRNPS